MIARLFSLLTIPLLALAIWGLIKQTRDEQRLSIWSPVIGLVMAPLMLFVNMVLLRQATPALLGPALLIGGLAFGLAWGQTARIYRKGQHLVTRRSILHLVFWAISYSVTQLLATFAPAWIVGGGLAAMFLSTGSSLGTNLNALVRQVLMPPPAAPPPDLPERQSAPPPGLPERG